MYVSGCLNWGTEMRLNFNKINKWAELLSYFALILGVPFGLIDLHTHAVEAEGNAKKERVEAAEKVYQTVDERFNDFVKLCIDHPRLDCYSVPRQPALNPPLSNDEKVQQKLLFAELTDVFEVAYVQYHKQESNPEIKRIYTEQWAGWDAYIRKFMKRPSYSATWYEIRDEYDGEFVKYLDTMAPSQQKVASLDQHSPHHTPEPEVSPIHASPKTVRAAAQ